MSAPEGFAALILTHGRADRVITHDALRRFGYTGPIYLIVDDQDDQIDRYRELYGDNVIVFDKAASVQNVDTGDQRDAVAAASVVFARNSTDAIAQRLQDGQAAAVITVDGSLRRGRPSPVSPRKAANTAPISAS